MNQCASPVERTWKGDRADVPLNSESLDLQRAQLLGQALREEERARKTRQETEEAILKMKAEMVKAQVEARTAAPAPAVQVVNGGGAPSIDEALAKARSRLIRWGIYATITMATVSGTLLLVYKYLKDLP